MNTHKYARLTFARRLEMVKQMTLKGLDAAQAAAAQGVTAQTALKWLGRYLSGGEAALARTSRCTARSSSMPLPTCSTTARAVHGFYPPIVVYQAMLDKRSQHDSSIQ